MIPGSKNVNRIKDKLDILEFRLTEEEMADIARLDQGERLYHRTDRWPALLHGVLHLRWNNRGETH